MNASTDIKPRSGNALHYRTFVNLLRKELRESRAILMTGVISFWIVPAILELVSLATDSRHETTALPLFVLTGLGWLFAVIVGADIVCRDWGKPEEHFLLSLPVTPRAAVCAKLAVGKR